MWENRKLLSKDTAHAHTQVPRGSRRLPWSLGISLGPRNEVEQAAACQSRAQHLGKPRAANTLHSGDTETSRKVWNTCLGWSYIDIGGPQCPKQQLVYICFCYYFQIPQPMLSPQLECLSPFYLSFTHSPQSSPPPGCLPRSPETSLSSHSSKSFQSSSSWQYSVHVTLTFPTRGHGRHHAWVSLVKAPHNLAWSSAIAGACSVLADSLAWAGTWKQSVKDKLGNTRGFWKQDATWMNDEKQALAKQAH